MLRDISSVTFAFFYVNILGYVFHSVISRSLGPVGYGEFMVLYSFMLTVGNITSLLATVSVKTLVENFDSRYEFLRSLRLIGIVLGVIFAFFVCLMSPYLKSFLYVTEYYYFFIIALVWLGMFMLAVERSFLQSVGKFPLFAFSSAMELTIRLITAVTVLLLGFKVGGVIFSSAAGIFAVLLFLLLKNSELFGKRAKLNIKKMVKIALYVSPSGFFVYADDIFIRRVFDESTAGLFASASIVGKVLIWLTLTLLGVYFPKFVRYKETSEIKRFFLQMVGLIFLIELLSQFVLLTIGEFLFLALFGEKFKEAVLYLPYYFLSVLPLLLTLLFISIFTALEKGFFLIYFHLLVYYLGFIVLSFTSVFSYIKYIFVVNLIFCFIYFTLLKAVFLKGKLTKININF
ncbi:MAG: oligosaccharide flippase family protein [Thermodesulfovibrio sp.]|nr:oligosaccharide flippase family protein [Thermodesulfovibrio sp.]